VSFGPSGGVTGLFGPVTTNYSRNLDWLATVRGRLGVTVAPALLLYGTGGLAVGETKIGNTFICPTCGPDPTTQPGSTNVSTRTSTGWTAGAGAEWGFAPQWSAKVEYLYVDLGRQSSTITYVYSAFSSLTSTVRNTENVVRAGINYRFGGPAVARY
jgi:outer membrane immunogenic protein